MTLLLFLLLCPPTSLTLFCGIELFAGLRPLRSEIAPPSTSPTAAIVVPAHDEEAIIGRTLTGLREAARDLARILVVADNCSDSTAEIVRQLGIEVAERVDPERRGKGFALDFARRQLEPSAPDLVIVIDADCTIDRAGLAALIDNCFARQLPCQSIYLLSPDPKASPLVQISSFAFLIKNLVRQRALQRLGGRVNLTGTGMAFPWPALACADLATSSIVEDLRLGIELAECGYPPQLVSEARVWSDAAPEDATLVQRRRWEGGFLDTAWNTAPRLILRALGRGDVGALVMGFDLMVPPLTLLILADAIALGGGLVLVSLTDAGWAAFVIFCGASAIAAAGLVAAWWAEGQTMISARRLALLPIYLLRKIPLYFGLAVRGQPGEWVRTERPRD